MVAPNAGGPGARRRRYRVKVSTPALETDSSELPLVRRIASESAETYSVSNGALSHAALVHAIAGSSRKLPLDCEYDAEQRLQSARTLIRPPAPTSIVNRSGFDTVTTVESARRKPWSLQTPSATEGADDAALGDGPAIDSSQAAETVAVTSTRKNEKSRITFAP